MWAARAELWEGCEAASFQLTCAAGRLLPAALSLASAGSPGIRCSP